MQPAGEERLLWFMVDGETEPSRTSTYTGHCIDDLKGRIHMKRQDIPEFEMVLLKVRIS